jgi:excisionase family DNA binding protein
MPDDGEWLPVKDAARLVNYHPERVRELIREGKVDAYKFGSVWAVKRKSLLQYVNIAYKKGEKRGPKPG